MTDLDTAADQKADSHADDEGQHAIQIAGAHLPSGEPVVVLMTGATVSILPLQLAQDVANALIMAIAGSVVADAVIPVVSAATQAAAEPALMLTAEPVSQTATAAQAATLVRSAATNQEASHG